MADNLIDFADKDELAVGEKNCIPEFSDFPQTLVTEKIIFCIDSLILTNKDETLIHNIFFLIKSYFALKKKICSKPPEFELLIVFSSDSIFHSVITKEKDLKTALSKVENFNYEEEEGPLKLDKIFLKIAEIVELPDLKLNNTFIPPNWAYHIIWLFGCNFYVPILEDTNPFDYLMMTPYVALDILYMYDNSLEKNKCEQISQALLGLNENGRGYFLPVNINTKSKFFSCFAQVLGHPLIRSPQAKAKFSINELGPQQDISEDNNIE